MINIRRDVEGEEGALEPTTLGIPPWDVLFWCV